MCPELSIIIPVVEESNVLQVVASLLNQNVEPSSYELLISDWRKGTCQAPIERIAREHPAVRVRYLRVDRGQLFRARGFNEAAALARGKVLILLAGDFTPEPHFVDAHRQMHRRRPELEAVGIGPARFVDAQRKLRFVEWLESSTSLFGANEGHGEANGYFYCGNASIKKDFYQLTGGFDEDFVYDAMDDYEFGVRLRAAGMRSYYVPDAFAWHEHQEDPDLAQRAIALAHAGEAAVVYEQKHPGPYGWTNSCDRSPLRLELDAALWGSIFLFRRNPDDLGKYYSCRLDAAFVRGWRRAKAL